MRGGSVRGLITEGLSEILGFYWNARMEERGERVCCRQVANLQKNNATNNSFFLILGFGGFEARRKSSEN